MREIRPFSASQRPTGTVDIRVYGVQCTICGRTAEYTTRIRPGELFMCAACEAEVNGTEKMHHRNDNNR
jgi:ribosome-binding protein aMBF1 (putative translation factor)